MTMFFDARTLGRGWLAVALASGKDKARPALGRTISIEQFDTGVRLVATDSYVLLRSWCPNLEDELAPEPDLDEPPLASAVAMDPHFRGRGFLGHALTLVAEAEKAGHGESVHVSLELGVIDSDDDAEWHSTLPGLAALWVVLELPDEERLKLQSYEGEYPNWRNMTFKPEKTTSIALNPDIVGRLAKLGKIQAGTTLGFEWAGKIGAARLELLDSDPRVVGLVMPCRWDFDRNEPRVDEEPAKDDDEDGDEE